MAAAVAGLLTDRVTRISSLVRHAEPAWLQGSPVDVLPQCVEQVQCLRRRTLPRGRPPDHVRVVPFAAGFFAVVLVFVLRVAVVLRGLCAARARPRALRLAETFGAGPGRAPARGGKWTALDSPPARLPPAAARPVPYIVRFAAPCRSE